MTRLTIFFSSDEHGHIGGAPALAREVAEARRENPHGVLLVSEGDVFEGSAVSSVLGPEPSQKLLKAMGYGAIALGNHDFDRGEDFARQWVRESPCPVLAANVREEDGSVLVGTRPSMSVEQNGTQLGLIGLTTPDTPNTVPAGALKSIHFSDPVAAAREELARLKAAGAQVVGVMSHLGLPADRQLASQVPGLTFILGGHTHDAHSQPEIINGTLILHPGCFRKSAGRLDLDLDAKGLVVGFDYRLLPTEGVESDDEVGRLVRGYEARIDDALGAQVTHLREPLDYETARRGDGMGLLLTEAMLVKTGTRVAFVNQKFARGSLPAGPLTRRQLLDVLPFDNRIQSLELPAGQVAAALLDSVRRDSPESLVAGGPASLAMTVEDRQPVLAEDRPDLPWPAQPRAFKSWDYVHFYAPREPVSVATTDYLLSGGLGYIQGDLRDQAHDHGMLRTAAEDVLREGRF